MLVHEGVLLRQTRRGNKSFHFHLFNDMLLYSDRGFGGFDLHQQFDMKSVQVRACQRSKYERSALLLCSSRHRPSKHHTNSLLSQVEDAPEGSAATPFAIKISTPKKSFVVFAEDQAEKNEWLAQLNTVTTKNPQQVEAEVSQVERARRMYSMTPHQREQLEAGENKAMVAPVWQVGDTKCSLCEVKFTFTNRKHHCRSCGALCCNACSPSRMVLKHIDAKKAQRVCSGCCVKLGGSPAPNKTPSKTLSKGKHNSSTSMVMGAPMPTGSSSPFAARCVRSRLELNSSVLNCQLFTVEIGMCVLLTRTPPPFPRRRATRSEATSQLAQSAPPQFVFRPPGSPGPNPSSQ